MGKTVKASTILKAIDTAATIAVWLCGKKYRVSSKELNTIESSSTDLEALKKLNLK